MTDRRTERGYLEYCVAHAVLHMSDLLPTSLCSGSVIPCQHRGVGPKGVDQKDKGEQDLRHEVVAFHHCNHGNKKQVCSLQEWNKLSSSGYL